VEECYDTREETSVASKPTSSMQWNILMHDAREHMWDMETWGDFSSWGKGCQVVKDIWKELLGEC
jgi:hypothetical protein